MFKTLLPYSEQKPTQQEIVDQNYFTTPKPYSFMEVAGKHFQAGIAESPTVLLSESFLPEEKPVDSAELNRYYGVDLFKTPTTVRSANYIYNKYRRDQELEGIAEVSNMGSVKSLVASFAGGGLAYMSDPINTALLYATNGTMNFLHKNTHLVKGMSKLIGETITTNIAEDLATSTANYAINKGMQDFTQQEPDITQDVAMSVAVNGFGMALRKAFPSLSSANKGKAKYMADMHRTPPSVREKILATEIWNEGMGATVKGLEPKKNVFDTVFESVTKNVNFSNPHKGVWAALTNEAIPLKNRVLHAGPRFGDGLVLHSNPQYPMGFAESFNSDAKLYNFELKLDKMKLINLADAATTDKGKFSFLKKEAEKRFGLKINKNNLAEVFNEIENKVDMDKAKELDQFFSYANKKLQEMGFQGYEYNIAGNTTMYKMFEGIEKEIEYSLDLFKPFADLKAPNKDFGFNVDPIGDEYLKFLQQSGMDINVPTIISEAFDFKSAKQASLLPMFMSKQQLMQSPQGWLSNGRRLKMDADGRINVTDLMSTDTEFQMGYTEIFSKDHIDRIQKLVTEDKFKQITKEFPDITNKVKENLKTIEEYKLYDAQEIAYLEAESFFKDTNWYEKPDKEIFSKLDTLGKLVDPTETENFLKNVEDIKALDAEKVKFQEEFTNLLIQEDNKIFKETARSILRDSEMKKLQESRDVKAMYKYLKEYSAKDSAYTKGVAEKSLKQFEKLADRTGKVEQMIKDKGQKINDIINMAGIKEGTSHYEVLMKPFNDFVQELKKNNPDMVETIIKAVEVCQRRNK